MIGIMKEWPKISYNICLRDGLRVIVLYNVRLLISKLKKLIL